MPFYELLGGASRTGVMVYGHANGETSPRPSWRRAHKEKGYHAIRAE